MKRTSTVPVLVAALALMAALAAGLTSSATGGTLAHASKHKSKPKVLSCRSVLKGETLTHEVTIETGIAPEVDPVSEENRFHDRSGLYHGFPLRECFLFWTNSSGNSTAYGNCDGCTPPAFVWETGRGVTTQVFNRIYAEETFNASLGGQTGGPFTKQRLPSLGGGSQAFLRTDDETDGRPNQKYPSDFGLYVLSKGKHGKPGNLFVLYAWPMTLDAEIQIVKGLLSHNVF